MKHSYYLDFHVVLKHRARITSHGNFHKKPYRDFLEHATAELSCQFRENNYQELQYPITLDVLFYNAPRCSDIDNLCGSIMDVLVKANIIKNDNLNCINLFLARNPRLRNENRGMKARAELIGEFFDSEYIS